MVSEFGTVANQFAAVMGTVLEMSALVWVLLILGMAFLLSPFSNVLNVITVPLGYKWSSCPYCMAVSVEKIEWADCANCGRRHMTNFGAVWYRDGDELRFCDSGCLDEFDMGGGQ